MHQLRKVMNSNITNKQQKYWSCKDAHIFLSSEGMDFISSVNANHLTSAICVVLQEKRLTC